MTNENQQKENVLATAMKELNKKYGNNTVLAMDKAQPIEIDAVSTGCYSLDYVFACGGIPRGRIIELYGSEGGGKSTLSMYLMSQIQKNGGKAMLVDAEFAFDSNYAEKIGVNVKELILSQPSTAEEALDIVDKMVSSNAIDIIVLDSVASLVPKKELEGEIGHQDVALQARLMSKALRVLTGNISKTKTIMIFVNQLRDKIGVFWGVKSASPGGRALKFYSSIRLEVKNIKKIKVGDTSIGNIMKISATKNKTGMPWRSCELNLIYGKGIDTVTDLFNVAVEKKIISKSGNTYSFGEIEMKAGKDHSIKWLQENPEILEKVKKEVF